MRQLTRLPPGLKIIAPQANPRQNSLAKSMLNQGARISSKFQDDQTLRDKSLAFELEEKGYDWVKEHVSEFIAG